MPKAETGDAVTGAADLATSVKGLATGTMNFAFGCDAKNASLLLHRTKQPAALAKQVKASGIKPVVQGTVNALESELVFDLDGRPVTGMKKRIQALLRAAKVSKYSTVTILVGGVEQADAPEGPATATASATTDSIGATADVAPTKPAAHAVSPQENDALAKLPPEVLAKQDLTQRDPKTIFTPQYMDDLVGLKIQGAKDPSIPDLMRKLQKGVTGGERKDLIAKLAKVRGVDPSELDVQYGRFLVLQAQQKAVEKQKGGEAVPDLNEKLHGDFMGSNPQLLFGKVVGDAFGIDPVFGALLSPTGGMVGPGNAALHLDDDDPTGYHGTVHDAAGYLLNYHDQGPGYDYLGKESNHDSQDPLTGQQSGMRYWHEKLDPGTKTEMLTGVIDGVYALKDLRTAVGKEVDEALEKARAEVGQKVDEALSKAKQKAGEARTVLEKTANEVAAAASAAKQKAEQTVTAALDDAREKLGNVTDSAAAKLDQAWNFVWGEA